MHAPSYDGGPGPALAHKRYPIGHFAEVVAQKVVESVAEPLATLDIDALLGPDCEAVALLGGPEVAVFLHFAAHKGQHPSGPLVALSLIVIKEMTLNEKETLLPSPVFIPALGQHATLDRAHVGESRLVFGEDWKKRRENQL